MSTFARVDVDLGPRSYPVLIGNGLLTGLGATLREHGLRHTAAFVITNTDVGRRYFKRTKSSLMSAGFERVERHNIPTGEEGKSWKNLSKTCAKLLESFPDTGSVPLVLLLGGGVVGDLGGFVAGIFRRGIPFVQLPTSLLAAVDSSVGGKVAVNFGGVKNILGVFNQPRLVVCDLDLLQSLPQVSRDRNDPIENREIKSGLSEVIKYGAVCSKSLFEQLEASQFIERVLALDTELLADVVTQCVTIKARVVEQDEFDKKGIRNVLNFGHTIGHAIELSAAEQGRTLAPSHGEAIAIGMIAATDLAEKLGMVDPSFRERLVGLLSRAGLPLSFSDFCAKVGASLESYGDLYDRILRAMQMDKKFRDGRNVFVLPTQIGAWQQRENVDWELVHAAVRSVLK